MVNASRVLLFYSLRCRMFPRQPNPSNPRLVDLCKLCSICLLLFFLRRLQRVHADRGFAPSRQALTIRGGAQLLEDNVPLKECCVSGVPVGGFSVNGWRELHLELRLKECVLPLDINLRVREHNNRYLFSLLMIFSDDISWHGLYFDCASIRAPLFFPKPERETGWRFTVVYYSRTSHLSKYANNRTSPLMDAIAQEFTVS